MTARIEVELFNGSKILIGGGHAAGSSLAIPNVSAYTFKTGLGSLVEIVEILEHAVASMANRPEKVEMEFGASVSSECNLCIVPGTEDAEFRVKLTWGQGQHQI